MRLSATHLGGSCFAGSFSGWCVHMTQREPSRGESASPEPSESSGKPPHRTGKKGWKRRSRCFGSFGVLFKEVVFSGICSNYIYIYMLCHVSCLVLVSRPKGHFHLLQTLTRPRPTITAFVQDCTIAHLIISVNIYTNINI